MNKEDLLLIKVTTTKIYVVPKTRLNERTDKELIADWFENGQHLKYNIGRDTLYLGNSEEFVSAEVVETVYENSNS